MKEKGIETRKTIDYGDFDTIFLKDKIKKGKMTSVLKHADYLKLFS